MRGEKWVFALFYDSFDVCALDAVIWRNVELFTIFFPALLSCQVDVGGLRNANSFET